MRGSQRKWRTATTAPMSPQTAMMAMSDHDQPCATPSGLAGVEGREHGVHEVADREDVADAGQPRVVAQREEHARHEEDGEEDPVDDRGRGVGVGDQRGHGHTERRERQRADEQRDDQGRPVARELQAVEEEAHRADEGAEDGGHHDGVEEQAAEHGAGRQRRAPEPLEDAGVPPDAEGHREVGERGADDPEAHDPGDVVLVVVDAPEEVDGAARVQRGEDDEEEDGEDEGEPGAGRVAPVALLLVAQLVQRERADAAAHASSSSLISAR